MKFEEESEIEEIENKKNSKIRRNTDDEDDSENENSDQNSDNAEDFIPGMGLDLADVLNSFLTNEDDVNIADILTGIKKSIDTQNKILMKMISAFQNKDK